MKNTIYDIRSTKYEKGFTLFEVLIAVFLVGIAVAALVGSNIAFTKANGIGTEITTAEFLAEQIRELTAMLPVSDPAGTAWITFGPEETGLTNYDDVDDFDGFNSTSLTAPIDSRRQLLTALAAYSQQVTVQNVSASNFETIVADRSSSFVRVTVKIYLNSKLISTTSWLRARY
jgi:prepilin-type N-terminal cleavage/methylation domain-containing protein